MFKSQNELIADYHQRTGTPFGQGVPLTAPAEILEAYVELGRLVRESRPSSEGY